MNMSKKYLLEPELAFLKKILLDKFIISETTTSKKFKLTKDEITFTLFDISYFWGADKKNVFKSLAFFEEKLKMKNSLDYDLLLKTYESREQFYKRTMAGQSDYGSATRVASDPLWDKMQKTTQRIVKNLPGCKTVSDILNKSYGSGHPLYENFIGSNSLESDLLEEFHHLMNIKLTIQDLPDFKENTSRFLDKYIDHFKNGDLDSRNKEFYGIAKHEEIFNQINLQKQGLDFSNIKVDFETLKTLKNIDLKKIRLIENAILQEKQGSIVIKDIFPLKDGKNQNALWGATYKVVQNNAYITRDKNDQINEISYKQYGATVGKSRIYFELIEKDICLIMADEKIILHTCRQVDSDNFLFIEYVDNLGKSEGGKKGTITKTQWRNYLQKEWNKQPKKRFTDIVGELKFNGVLRDAFFPKISDERIDYNLSPTISNQHLEEVKKQIKS